ncbi:hypothetical protein PG988_016172 [Apiospora saccharicola]
MAQTAFGSGLIQAWGLWRKAGANIEHQQERERGQSRDGDVGSRDGGEVEARDGDGSGQGDGLAGDGDGLAGSEGLALNQGEHGGEGGDHVEALHFEGGGWMVPKNEVVVIVGWLRSVKSKNSEVVVVVVVAGSEE